MEGWVGSFGDGLAILQIASEDGIITGTSSWVFVTPPSHEVQTLSTAVSGVVTGTAVNMTMLPAPLGVRTWPAQMAGGSLILTYQASDGTIRSISFTQTTIAAFNDKVAAFRNDKDAAFQAEQSAAASANQAQQSAAAANIEATASCTVELSESSSTTYETGWFYLVVSGLSAPAECRSLTAALTPTNAAVELHIDQTDIPAATPHGYVLEVMCSGIIDGFSVTIYYDLGVHSFARDACSTLGLTAR